jgi:hypothetical protein
MTQTGRLDVFDWAPADPTRSGRAAVSVGS